tara:strand:- start:2891 stop:3115 length:225 start_codon:yes stop_codon:yes gene_type:complete
MSFTAPKGAEEEKIKIFKQISYHTKNRFELISTYLFEKNYSIYLLGIKNIFINQSEKNISDFSKSIIQIKKELN